MKKSYRLLLLVLMTLPGIAYSQNYTPNIVPPSPDAAALGKYGELPVGTYTGIPEINIPLYEIKTGALSHDISLSYHAGGVKVEDMASNVGLGWSMNAGGAITRTVQGLPDDAINGLWSNTVPPGMTGISDYDLKQIARNNLDAIPDNFYYNFGKYSGRIVFTKAKVPYTIPYENFKINPTFSGGELTSWAITTEEGVTYTFAKREISTTNGSCFDSRVGGIPNGSWITSTYTSAWFVTNIQAPLSGEAISFSYTTFGTNYTFNVPSEYSKHLTLEIQSCAGGASEPNYYTSCSTQITVNGVELSLISYRGGSVSFSYGTRPDLTGGSRITGLAVTATSGTTIKQFTFDNNSIFNSTCSTQDCKRLKLNSVTEIGRNGVALKPHVFNYNNEALPSRFSYDVDHWGYYNKRGNTYQHPEFVNYFNEYVPNDYIEGAVRKPDPDASKAGILTQIIYPTGGYTNFDYELNDVISDKLPNKSNPQPAKQLSGNSSVEQAGPTFVVQGYFQAGQYVDVTFQTVGCSTSSIPSFENMCPYVKIKRTSGTPWETVLQSGTLQKTRFFLANGTYQLRGGNAAGNQSYSIQVRADQEINSPNKYSGGLRLKSIVDSDGLGNYNQRFYDYNDTDGQTTGRMLSYPLNYYYNNYAYYTQCSIGECYIVPEFILTTGSNITLGMSRGSYVGYGKVTELRGATGQYGKSEYFYTSVWKSEKDNNALYRDANVYSPPWGPPTDETEFKRGFLLNKIDYKYNPGTVPYFTKVLENSTVYKVIGTATNILGLKVAIARDNPCYPADLLFAQSSIKRVGGQAFVTDYSTEFKYNDDGSLASQIKTTPTINPVHLQVTSELVTFQDAPQAWSRETKYKYPPDYGVPPTGNTGAAAGIQAMSASNAHTHVVEKQVWETRNGVSALIDGEINIFKSTGIDIDTIQKLKTVSSATPIISYTPSAVSSGTFTYDRAKFRRVASYEIYDATGRNLNQWTGVDGVTRSFLWAHSDLYPIAEAVNAKLSSIAYTSFEESTAGGINGNWNWSTTGATRTFGDGVTGDYFLTGSMETNNTLPAGQYTLSLWANGSGSITVTGGSIPVSGTGWNPYTTTVTLAAAGKVTVNTNTGVKLDEVRIYPVGALMKSFTYKPFIGMTGANDETNFPLNYKYDDNNRLTTVQDYTGNIIKKFSYNLRGYTGTVAGSGINSAYTHTGTYYPGGTVTFTAVNTDTGATYNWDFGDGTTGTTRVASHVYAAAGNYIVRLTASKGTDLSFTDQDVLIKIPNPAAPTVVISSGPTMVGTIADFPNLPREKYSITATATPSDGVKPGQTYSWGVTDDSGTIPDYRTVSGGTSTSATNTYVFSAPLQLLPSPLPNCQALPTRNFKLVCWVSNSVEHSESDRAKVPATYAPHRTLVVSPGSANFGYSDTGVLTTFTVTDADSNISPTTSSSWINISQVVQCNSFKVSVDANTSTTGRTGHVTLSASNGTLVITITQTGAPPNNGCGEGCFRQNGQCICP